MRKSTYWLAGLVVVAVACGGDDDYAQFADAKSDSGSEWQPEDPNSQGQSMQNGGGTNAVQFVVKKDDGLFYGVTQVSETAFSGTIEELYPGGGKQFVKVYQGGMLTSVDEFYELSNKKKSSIVYNNSGQVVSKEEWNEDGSKTGAVAGVSAPKSNKVGRNVPWKELTLNIYEGKPTSTILTAFGLPDDRKVFQLATSYHEEWFYKNIKISGFDNKIVLKTVKFRVEKKLVTSVQVY